MKATRIQIVLALFMSVLTLQPALAANKNITTITGTQTRGSIGRNASLHCTPVTITTPKKIISITGYNKGFWISNSRGKRIMSFYKPNDSSAKGKTLPAGTYTIYPNLKDGANKASVTIKLK